MSKRKIKDTNRAFNGVWIPKKYWLDEDLSAMEVLFMAEIESLDSDNGCFASNTHFAEFFGVSAGRVSQIINSLKDRGYLEISYNKKGKQVLNRVIRVVNKLNKGIKNTKAPIKNSKEGYLENAKESNTTRVIQDSNTDIEKDDDDDARTRETDPADENPFDVATQAGINVNSGFHLPVFVDFVKALGSPVVCWAIRKTADTAQHPNWSYLLTVLKDLEANSVRTIEQAEKLSKEHKQKTKQGYQGRSAPQVREDKPDWMTHPYKAPDPKLFDYPDDSEDVMPDD